MALRHPGRGSRDQESKARSEGGGRGVEARRQPCYVSAATEPCYVSAATEPCYVSAATGPSHGGAGSQHGCTGSWRGPPLPGSRSRRAGPARPRCPLPSSFTPPPRYPLPSSFGPRPRRLDEKPPRGLHAACWRYGICIVERESLTSEASTWGLRAASRVRLFVVRRAGPILSRWGSSRRAGPMVALPRRRRPRRAPRKKTAAHGPVHEPVGGPDPGAESARLVPSRRGRGRRGARGAGREGLGRGGDKTLRPGPKKERGGPALTV